MQWNEETLMAARDRHEEWLMQQPTVQGSSIGYDRQGRLCVVILTDGADAQERERIRNQLSGVPVAFEETGPIEAQ